MLTRRKVLATTGMAAMSAGCIGAGATDSSNNPDDDGNDVNADDSEDNGPDDGGNEDTASEPTPANGIQPGEIHLQNADDTTHEIQLALEVNGEIKFLNTYSLSDGGESKQVTDEWNETTASFRVHARLDDGEVQTIEITNCSSILMRIETEGKLGIWRGDCS